MVSGIRLEIRGVSGPGSKMVVLLRSNIHCTTALLSLCIFKSSTDNINYKQVDLLLTNISSATQIYTEQFERLVY